MEIHRDYHYDAAHWLPYVPEGHKCGRMHGHTYRLTVFVEGEVGDDGFVIDFADLDDVVCPTIKQLDHYCLNDIKGLENPTVEIQLDWLWQRLWELPLSKLVLYEGLNNGATYHGP
jgi:6-pyruvoyltetrahydropterin/6-carboxytetrahydropterin synthase